MKGNYKLYFKFKFVAHNNKLTNMFSFEIDNAKSNDELEKRVIAFYITKEDQL